jgi:acetolactate synthase-1/2/3 large subunit
MKGRDRMNGAEALIGSAIRRGIEICFANAGTTELPIVVAMDRIGGIKAVLGLFEGVCTGAADGYGRLSGKPAMNLLHMGPGFANGIANLHNARRANTPILNIIGEHATWHRPADPPLAMDIEGLSATVSSWTCTNKVPSDLPLDVANGISIALGGRIASLIVPHDHQLAACNGGSPGTDREAF